jgi:uncharacterized membrane protein
MKNIQTLLLKLILVSGLLAPAICFASEKDEIWSYVFLIPVYFILAAQSLIVILALLMKQFNKKQNVVLSASVAGIFMSLGLGLTLYLQSADKLWTLLQFFAVIGAIVFVSPVIQFTLLNKSGNNPEENEA